MPQSGNQVTLDAGTYQIILNRLKEQSHVLNERLAALNESRKVIFNTEQFALIANQRITTEYNGVARGIIAIGEICIFAYNVHFGLREEIALQDVFSIYHFADNYFEPCALDIIADPQFETDFKNLYKYYRDAIFSKFIRTEHYLYMIFQTSKNVSDRKAFKWHIDGQKLTYIDDRSIHEAKSPNQYDFNFQATSLEDRRLGLHPHISILDKVFIEAIGGDITFKIEDNTSTGLGIYSEHVSNKDQQLDDAKYFYADLGNLIAIKIQPYQEDFRAFIFNVRTKEVYNIPSLLKSAILLPNEQGIIFSNGYYLQNGEFKLFDNNLNDLEFMRMQVAPNGEDYLYIYYQKTSNTYVLMSYNVILQQVNTPIICNGFTIFNDGKLIYFRSENEAIRHHQVQIWQTPFTASLIENKSMADNVLYKIGNKDIVRAMSEAYEIIQLLKKEDSYEGLYEDIAKQSATILDAYFWLSDEATYNIASPLKEIGSIAETAIDEFAKVQAQRQFVAAALHDMQTKVQKLKQDIRNASYKTVDELVLQLHKVRLAQGAIIELKQLRYMDLAAVEELLSYVQQLNEQLSQQTIDFLLTANALQPYEIQIDQQRLAIQEVNKVIDAKKVEQACLDIATQLELLIDILNSLKIDDTTQTTQIIQDISVLFANLNELKALLIKKVNTLKSSEAIGQFHAQMTLLEQSIVNFLDLCDTVQKCEEYYTKIAIHIEELESKFADFEEFIIKIADKRDEVIKAFNAKKELLIAQINKRTGNLEQIGLRILKNIETKAASFKSREEIYSFFAGDLMIEKIRNLGAELQNLGDVSKSEYLLNALKLAQETAIRNLQDKNDLFVDGQNIIALGTHKFLVNKQELSLTIVQQNGQFKYHLMGTNFYHNIPASNFDKYQSVCQQDYITENTEVYRAEFLAYQTFKAYQLAKDNFDEALFINQLIEKDFAAGYIKGVHNVDAILIFDALKKMAESLGILQYTIPIRVKAQLFWRQLPATQQEILLQWIKSAHRIHTIFATPYQNIQSFQLLLHDIKKANSSLDNFDAGDMAIYLMKELSEHYDFTVSSKALHIKADFIHYLQAKHQLEAFELDVKNTNYGINEKMLLLEDWVQAYVNTLSNAQELSSYISEVAILLLFSMSHFREKIATDKIIINALNGAHNRIVDDTLTIQFHEFLQRLSHFETYQVPLFEEFQSIKRQLLASYEQQLKLNEMKPKVLSSFMRNQLINKVYFPMIGANLSKQLGTVGENMRTARMGMLLLISPPGYGKTTLMEYLASTMGLHFVKINAPTIGHRIHSIDPAEAATSGARAELQKINLSFEMADNVMLYLDDIQHCSPEFLQQFISLADGQRKIDGIFEGESKTYDLRGKRFCIVMAGNPYTESGNLFKIPDMLANRSDVYNLGDVVGESRSLFQLSLIENAISENTYLQAIANKNMQDLYKLVQYVEMQEPYRPDFEGNYVGSAIEDAIAVLENLLFIRNIVLQVNDLYIQSAAMKDTYRVEPAFKLQGSYRNMNRMAAKIVPLMNEQELVHLVISHYEAESQTLTTDAEANVLKLKSIMKILNEKETLRYAHIIETFRKNNQFAGIEQDDKNSQMLLQIASINEHFKALVKAVNK